MWVSQKMPWGFLPLGRELGRGGRRCPEEGGLGQCDLGRRSPCGTQGGDAWLTHVEFSLESWVKALAIVLLGLECPHCVSPIDTWQGYSILGSWSEFNGLKILLLASSYSE